MFHFDFFSCWERVLDETFNKSLKQYDENYEPT